MGEQEFNQGGSGAGSPDSGLGAGPAQTANSNPGGNDGGQLGNTAGQYGGNGGAQFDPKNKPIDQEHYNALYRQFKELQENTGYERQQWEERHASTQRELETMRLLIAQRQAGQGQQPASKYSPELQQAMAENPELANQVRLIEEIAKGAHPDSDALKKEVAELKEMLQGRQQQETFAQQKQFMSNQLTATAKSVVAEMGLDKIYAERPKKLQALEKLAAGDAYERIMADGNWQNLPINHPDKYRIWQRAFKDALTEHYTEERSYEEALRPKLLEEARKNKGGIPASGHAGVATETLTPAEILLKQFEEGKISESDFMQRSLEIGGITG
jgi:hypothetical protein